MQHLSHQAGKQGRGEKILIKMAQGHYSMAIKHKGTIAWLSHCQTGRAVQDPEEKGLPASCHSPQAALLTFKFCTSAMPVGQTTTLLSQQDELPGSYQVL